MYTMAQMGTIVLHSTLDRVQGVDDGTDVACRERRAPSDAAPSPLRKRATSDVFLHKAAPASYRSALSPTLFHAGAVASHQAVCESPNGCINSRTCSVKSSVCTFPDASSAYSRLCSQFAIRSALVASHLVHPKQLECISIRSWFR